MCLAGRAIQTSNTRRLSVLCYAQIGGALVGLLSCHIGRGGVQAAACPPCACRTEGARRRSRVCAPLNVWLIARGACRMHSRVDAIKNSLLWRCVVFRFQLSCFCYAFPLSGPSTNRIVLYTYILEVYTPEYRIRQVYIYIYCAIGTAGSEEELGGLSVPEFSVLRGRKRVAWDGLLRTKKTL